MVPERGLAGEVLELYNAGAFSFWEWRPSDDLLSTHGFLAGGTLKDWLLRIHPRDQVVFSEFLDQDWKNPGALATIDYRFNANRQGNWLRLRHTAKPIEREGQEWISGIVELITPPHRSRTLLERMEKEMIEGETRLREFMGGVNLLDEHPEVSSILEILRKSLRADTVLLVRLDSRLDIMGMHSPGGSQSFRARALGSPLRQALSETDSADGVFMLDLDPGETECPWLVAVSVRDSEAKVSGVICAGFRNLQGRTGSRRFYSLLPFARNAVALSLAREKEDKQRAEVLSQLRKSLRSSGLLRLSQDMIRELHGERIPSGQVDENSRDASFKRMGWPFPSEAGREGVAETTMSRWLQAGRAEPGTPEGADLNQAVEAAARVMRGALDGSSELVLDLASGLLPVQANGGLLQELVLLLMMNARDAMPRGGRITVGTRSPDAGQEAAGISLHVSDEGAPRQAAMLAPLLRGPISPGSEEALAHPGLYLLNSAVAEWGGTIRVSEGNGPGNRICLSLPVAPGQIPTSPKRPISGLLSRNARHPSLEGATILLVEDEMAVRKLVRKLLEVLGCSVIEAVTGREALEMWPEIRGEVSLVVSDIVMPDGVSGWDLARELHDRHPDLGILLTSGYGDRPKDHGLGDIPTIGFLQKPYTVDILRESLHRLCSNGVALRS